MKVGWMDDCWNAMMAATRSGSRDGQMYAKMAVCWVESIVGRVSNRWVEMMAEKTAG